VAAAPEKFYHSGEKVEKNEKGITHEKPNRVRTAGVGDFLRLHLTLVLFHHRAC
jgi:hypothetical protein